MPPMRTLAVSEFIYFRLIFEGENQQRRRSFKGGPGHQEGKSRAHLFAAPRHLDSALLTGVGNNAKVRAAYVEPAARTRMPRGRGRENENQGAEERPAS